MKADTTQQQGAGLQRGLSLLQATAVNTIDMVGIGPFITLSGIVAAMHGPLSILAWLLGALLAFMDGMVWAEMGAKWPEAGGSYVFLQKLFPREKGGRLMAFLFTWQTSLQAPLVVASAAIGFTMHFRYLWDPGEMGRRLMNGGVVLMMVLLLYRDIKSIGRISVLLWIITGGTILWMIGSSFLQFHPEQAFDFRETELGWGTLFFAALGNASLSSIYSYLGYYNVCHLGGEIKDPQRNIPRAIFISIALITVFYLGMQTAVLAVLPAQQIAASKFVVIEYFETLYNVQVARVATALVLCIALSSLFSVLLGYSRVPYAAALRGDFFPYFARLHPTRRFPHRSLLLLGGLGLVLSMVFTDKPKPVITTIITMRILVQFVAQAVGVIRWHYIKPREERPYRMPLFPLPALLSVLIWLFVLFSSEWVYLAFSMGVILLGIIIYYGVLHKSVPENRNTVFNHEHPE